MIRKIGDKLILVGVAHILPKSRRDVEEAILEEEPEVVGVELCEARYIELTMGAPKEKSGISGFSRTALLAKVLNFFQEMIGKKTGMLPGEEMLAAIEKSRKIGAEVALIDRDINVTLHRLLNKMSSWEKLKLLSQVVFSLFKGDEFDIEDLTEDEVVEELISTFREVSETAYNVLIKERNEFMSNQISALLSAKSGKVLCVVGAGHVPGLVEELESRLEEDDSRSWDSRGTDFKLRTRG